MANVQDAFKITEKFHRKINQFCAPIVNMFGVNQFYHGKLLSSGEWVGINMNQEWANCYFSDDYFLHDPLLRHPDNHQGGIIFVSNLINSIEDEKTNAMLNRAKINFGIHISLVIVNKLNDGMEFFIFGLTSSDRLQSTKLYNEIPLLRLFIKQFKEKFLPLYSALDELQIDMSGLIGKPFKKPSFNILPQPLDRQQFLEQIGIEMPKSLTPREFIIVKHLIKGLSAPKIAQELFISPRTVEHHLERIKDKFDCFSKSELIQKLYQLDSCGYLAL